MTREEKQKAINALKISTPVMVVTQEEFNDYIQTLNKIMDWLEQDTVLFDFELYQAGLMDIPKEMIKVLDQIKAEIMDTGAYEQEVNGKTEFLKGINYCLGVIDKYKKSEE